MIPEQPRGYSIRLKPQADRILVVEPVSQFAYTLSSAPRSTPAFTVKSSADHTGRAYIVCRLSASTMTRQDSATARQDRGYSPPRPRLQPAVIQSGACSRAPRLPPGAWGLLSRVAMVVMTTQPSLGLLGALGQRLWHGLITARPRRAESDFS